MFKKIIAATDGSEHARKATELASELAAKYGAKLILIHVLQHETFPEAVRRGFEHEHILEQPRTLRGGGAQLSEMLAGTASGGGAEAGGQRILEAWGRQTLEQAASAARQRGVRDVHMLLEEGDPAGRILECVRRENPELLVTGSRGLSDLKGLFVGSVSHKLCQLASCTCITVK